jgi:hypothetical protein
MNKWVSYTVEQKKASDRFSRIKSRFKNLENHWTREKFIDWFINKDKKCFYCKCTQAELDIFYNLHPSKRYLTRGKSLEIERKDDKEYSEENCEFACYWCNNAKSDVFSSEEFMPIGKAIGEVIIASIAKKTKGLE